jgi:ABC-type phosphate/phosphonate transport system substrate-binding protein
MYPFDALRPAWGALWAAVHERAPWLPAVLRWTDDVHSCWTDPACALSHACGWPVVNELRDRVRVVGAFTLSLPDADGHRYRSVVLARDDRPLAARAPDVTVAAVSSDDSLSGWISLGVAAGGERGRWPGVVRRTGSHLASVRTLAAGEADVASVDALSWSHIGRFHPELVGRLHVVGRGPWVPSPPIVVSTSTPLTSIDDVRQAFHDAMADPAIEPVRHELLLDGFVALDHRDYEPVLRLSAAS